MDYSDDDEETQCPVCGGAGGGFGAADPSYQRGHRVSFESSDGAAAKASLERHSNGLYGSLGYPLHWSDGGECGKLERSIAGTERGPGDVGFYPPPGFCDSDCINDEREHERIFAGWKH